MASNVGNPTVYEAGDQRTKSNAEIEQEKKDARFHEGKDNSHQQGDRSEHGAVERTVPPLIYFQRTRGHMPTP